MKQESRDFSRGRFKEHVIDCAANDGSGPGAGGVLGASTKHVVEVLYSSQCPRSGWMIDGIRNHIGKLDVGVRLVNTDDRR